MKFSICHGEHIGNPTEFNCLRDIHHFIQVQLNLKSYSLFYLKNSIASEEDFRIVSNLKIGALYNDFLEITVVDHTTADENGHFNSSLQCSANLEISKWKVVRELGKGAFGRVYLAVYDNQYWAVKASQPNRGDSILQICNELELLKSISHPNVIKYIAFEYTHEYDSNGTAFMAMEYLSRGSLLDLIKKSGPISVKSSRLYGKQILAALIYIHSKNIIHRDVKCGNCLLDNSNNLKLSDFGLATKLVQDNLKPTGFVGTPYFMAPEVINNAKYRSGSSFPCDIWSFACTIVQMLSAKMIWSHLKPLKACQMIVKEDSYAQAVSLLKTSGIISDHTNGVFELLKCTLIIEPTQRPSAVELANEYKFFKLDFF